MKKLSTMLLCLMALFLSSVASQGQTYNRLYVFGDSLSDTHNEYDLTGSPAAPYYNGRWSNGPLWVEDLTASLGLTFDNATDYAVGGATTGSVNVDSPLLSGMQQQVNGYVAAHPTADPRGLYVLWGGGNDYFDQLGNSAPFDYITPTTNLANEMTLLAKHGASRFLIVNLPDLSTVPAAAQALEANGITGKAEKAILAQLHKVVVAHNKALEARIDALQQAYPCATFTLVDVYTLVQNVIQDPDDYGFTNVTGDYLDYLTANPTTHIDPNTFLFFDNTHPTKRGHRLISNLAYTTLKQ